MTIPGWAIMSDGAVVAPSAFGVPDYDEASLRATVYDLDMRVTNIELRAAAALKRELH